MGIIEQQLAPFASQLFAGLAVGASNSIPCLPLRMLYDRFNGGFFWGRALLIRPVERIEGGALTIAEWNDEALWKGQYEGACADITFFAEDAFGFQLGTRGESVIQLDPETASITHIADTISKWCMEVRRDPEFHTGFPVLNAWERKNRPLSVGHRLIPKQLFSLGGEFNSDNMVCKADVEGMRIRGQFWKLTRDLPDGQKIVFRVVGD